MQCCSGEHALNIFPYAEITLALFDRKPVTYDSEVVWAPSLESLEIMLNAVQLGEVIKVLQSMQSKLGEISDELRTQETSLSTTTI